MRDVAARLKAGIVSYKEIKARTMEIIKGRATPQDP
jgi:hypothetical protein